MWRLLIGIGCIPACFALYFRLTIPEDALDSLWISNVNGPTGRPRDVDNFLTTGTFVVDPDAVVQRAQAPKATRRDFLQLLLEVGEPKDLDRHFLVLVRPRCKHSSLDL